MDKANDAIDDIEDGEIESDDDDNTPIITPVVTAPIVVPKKEHVLVPNVIEPKKSHSHQKSSRKNERERERESRKNNIPVEDDFAENIANAIASALKKDGVEPPQPSIKKSSDYGNKRKTENEHDGKRGGKKKKKSSHSNSNSNKNPIVELLGEMEQDIDFEYEMMNVRGGSPPPVTAAPPPPTSSRTKHENRSDSEDSYSSNGSQEEKQRKNRRREKNRRDGKERDRRRRKRDDSDDDRPTGPRKMEICKFYLQDCCAKREKCLYMHSDFPCKYYYLGLKCKDKEECLFSHGKPLSDQHRNILLKHLETAPQEILGNFPRISRENAINMLAVNHKKLQQKFNMETENKIPSLLDVVTVKPPNANSNKQRNRKSRWCAPSTPTPLIMNAINPPVAVSTKTGNDYLNLKYLTGVLSQSQIENLEKIGIENLDQINQLTVAQLNEFGLTIGQIHELQLNGMNIKKIQEKMTEGGSLPEMQHPQELPITTRTALLPTPQITPQITTSPTIITPQINQTPTEPPPNTLGGKDIDMRFLAIPEAPKAETNILITSAPTVDYSQYIKDSNLNDDDLGDDKTDEYDDDDDENSLKINIDEEKIEKAEQAEQPEQPEQPLLPPIIAPIIPVISAPVSIPVSVPVSIPFLTPPQISIPSFYNKPEVVVEEEKVPEKVPERIQERQRISIYDEDYAENDVEEEKASLDKDMRFSSLLINSNKIEDDINNDVDLRLPFKPIMTHYVPATEIDGSTVTNVPIKYKVVEIEIPKPDYKDIRKNSAVLDRTSDPRLRRIFGIQDSFKNDVKLIPTIASPTRTGPAQPSVQRLDPRRKNETSSDTEIPKANTSNLLDIQMILLKSVWYKDLSSKHKIMVNQQLAFLSTEMKKFHHSDKSDDNLNEFMMNLRQNQMLQLILTNLNVYINDSVCFCEINTPPNSLLPDPILFNQPPPLLDPMRFGGGGPEQNPGLLGPPPIITNHMPFDQFMSMGLGNEPQWKNDDHLGPPNNNRNNNRNRNNRWNNNSKRGRDNRNRIQNSRC